MRTELSRGFAAWRAGDYAVAQEIFAQALAVDPAHGEAWSGVGHVAWSERRFEHALEAFRQAARHEPFSASHWSNVGLALRDLGRHTHALHALEVATRVEPSYAPAYNEWANVLCDLGRHAEAVPLYHRALALDARRAVVHHNLGVCMKALGQPFVADSCFREALKLDPYYHHALEELGILMLERERLDQAYHFLRAARSPRAEQLIAAAGLQGRQAPPFDPGDPVRAMATQEKLGGDAVCGRIDIRGLAATRVSTRGGLRVYGPQIAADHADFVTGHAPVQGPRGDEGTQP